MQLRRFWLATEAKIDFVEGKPVAVERQAQAEASVLSTVVQHSVHATGASKRLCRGLRSSR